jgi:hypothetical protein
LSVRDRGTGWRPHNSGFWPDCSQHSRPIMLGNSGTVFAVRQKIVTIFTNVVAADDRVGVLTWLSAIPLRLRARIRVDHRVRGSC